MAINPRALQQLRNTTGIGKGDNMGEKFVNTLMSPINTPLNIAADAIEDAVKVTGKYGRITKKTDPGIQNLWTGRREGAGGIAIAGVAGAGYMGYSTMNQTVMAPKTGQISYGGTLAVMDADGVSSNTQAPTLGAGGNMVFGLHNARKG